MFGELPKLLDRNFALAYFFPSMVFITLTNILYAVFGISKYILPYFNGEDIVNDLTVVVAFSYVIGIFFLLANSTFYRFLEGYGRLNPSKLFTGIEKHRYRNLIRAIKELDDDYQLCIKNNTEFPAKSRQKRNRLMIELSYRFPDREEYILPTPFGNRIRAFEIYSRVMYGFEYIDGWSRLLAVIPEDYRVLVDNAKAKTDLWVNSFFLSLILLVHELIIWQLTHNPAALVIFGITLLFYFSCIKSAEKSVTSWGDYVKSAFDVYRYHLLDLLEIPRPETRDDERSVWTKFSQSVVYRIPDIMPEIKLPRKNLRSESKSRRSKPNR